MRRAFCTATASAPSSSSRSPIFVTGLKPDSGKKASTDIFGRDRRGRLLKQRENEIKIAAPSDLAALACHSARDFNEIMPHVFKRVQEVGPKLRPSDRVSLLISFFLGKQGSRKAVSLLYKGLVDDGISQLKVDELVILLFSLANFKKSHNINHCEEVKVLSNMAVRLLLDVHSPAGATSPETPNGKSRGGVVSPEEDAKISATSKQELEMVSCQIIIM